MGSGLRATLPHFRHLVLLRYPPVCIRRIRTVLGPHEIGPQNAARSVFLGEPLPAVRYGELGPAHVALMTGHQQQPICTALSFLDRRDCRSVDC